MSGSVKLLHVKNVVQFFVITVVEVFDILRIRKNVHTYIFLVYIAYKTFYDFMINMHQEAMIN